jgi:hypothetical protein
MPIPGVILLECAKAGSALGVRRNGAFQNCGDLNLAPSECEAINQRGIGGTVGRQREGEEKVTRCSHRLD